MQAIDFSFLDLRFLDIIDILLVAVIIYYIYNLIRGTIAVNILLGLVIIYFVYILVKQAHMRLLTEILGGFVSVGFLALIIVFQQEIRRFLLLIGKNASFQKNAWWSVLFGKKEVVRNNLARIKPVVDACKSMQKSRTGALIVFAKYFDEEHFHNSGEPIDAKVSKRLLESIFQKHSPLHDGAVVITEGKLKVASCILPLTENDKLPLHFGLRHRAGIGISEVSDSVAVIVSEETGQIAYAKQGRARMNISISELEKLLNKDF
jgi:diadenylate cyclase